MRPHIDNKVDRHRRFTLKQSTALDVHNSLPLRSTAASRIFCPVIFLLISNHFDLLQYTSSSRLANGIS